MKKGIVHPERGSTLVVTVGVVATILVLLSVAVEYTTQISRLTQRSRKTAVAMEIADGHLEMLFTSWRNIYRSPWNALSAGWNGGTSLAYVGTNYFYTVDYNPDSGCPACPAPTPVPGMASPSPTPPRIPRPSTSLFPSDTDYQLTQYRIQAVDPMITLDSNGNALTESGAKGHGGWAPLNAGSAPPPAYGPNTWQYSLFYLASVDVTVPTLRGNVTAKVRRVFEKKYDQPWTFAMFFVDDLEFQPSKPFTINGPVHTNANLYIGNNLFTATSLCAYGGDYVNGFSPKDTRYPGTPTSPTFPSNAAHDRDIPPAQVSPYLPFGWSLTLSTAESGANNDSYHEIIERPVGTPDQLSGIRYYNQPGIHRVIINANGTAVSTSDRLDSTGAVQTQSTSAYTSTSGSAPPILNFGRALFDARENAAVKVVDVDISGLVARTGSLTGWSGLLYLGDDGAQTFNVDGSEKRPGAAVNVTVNGVTYPNTKRRAFRLINGHTLPAGGLTIISETPVYIQGDYNTGGTGTNVQSNNGTYTTPVAGSHQRKASAVMADAVTILSRLWNDNLSSTNNSNARIAANTTINTAVVAGNVPTSASGYSGGGENFFRLLEDWKDNTLCYYGSMVQLYASNQARGVFDTSGTVFKSPLTTKFYYDDAIFSTDSPPGRLEIAAYLQQQRWYQVY